MLGTLGNVQTSCFHLSVVEYVNVYLLAECLCVLQRGMLVLKLRLQSGDTVRENHCRNSQTNNSRITNDNKMAVSK